MALSGRYPSDVRTKAIEAVDRRRTRNPRDRTIFREIALEFNVGEQSLRLWVKQNDAQRLESQESTSATSKALTSASVAEPAKTTSTKLVEEEVKMLRRQVQKLRAENDVLKRAFVMFSSEWSKPNSNDD